jgi:hypothetical protein
MNRIGIFAETFNQRSLFAWHCLYSYSQAPHQSMGMEASLPAPQGKEKRPAEARRPPATGLDY